MSSLNVKKDGNRIVLAGSLDENSDLKPLEGLSGPVVISFKGITRVNSCGVREWVNLLQKMSKANLTYEECSVTVVKQLNAVPDFMGRARVVSFFAPYFCEDTDEESTELIQSTEIVNGQPPGKKNADGKDLTFDAIAKQYFSFLGRKAA